jgi:hypothetical protein
MSPKRFFLKTDGDDIADEFMASMADLANYTISEFFAKQFLRCPRKNNNRSFCKIRTPDGEIHYVHQEFKTNGSSANYDFDKARAKKTLKKEAGKPLRLMRED